MCTRVLAVWVPASPAAAAGVTPQVGAQGSTVESGPDQGCNTCRCSLTAASALLGKDCLGKAATEVPGQVLKVPVSDVLHRHFEYLERIVKGREPQH